MFYKELKINDIDYINNLKTDVRKNIKKTMFNSTNVKGKMTFYRHYIDNELFKKIEEITPEYKWYDAWGTILTKNQYVQEHDHTLRNNDSNNIVTHSAVFYLTNIQPGTYFKNQNVTVEPEVGKIIIFSCKELHSVAKYEGDEERITIAFNGRKREEYELN